MNLEYNNGGKWFPYKGGLYICAGDMVVDEDMAEYALIFEDGKQALVKDVYGDYGNIPVEDLQLLVRASTSIEVYRGPADEMSSWL